MALEDFLWYLQSEKKMSPATISAYKSDLNSWQQEGFDWSAPNCVDKSILADAIEKLNIKGLKESTMARRMASLRSMIRFRNLMQPSWSQLLDLLPPAREEAPLPKALSVEQIKNFLNIEIDGLGGPSRMRALRNRALLELLYASGLRVSEIAALAWQNIDEDQGVLRIIGKGNKERFVPYSERAFGWVEKYRDEARQDWADSAPHKYKDLVFLSHRSKGLTRMAIWKIVHRRALECGLDDIHPHVLRHSFATHLLQGGADIRIVQALLGHSSLNTTERYLKIDDSELQKVFETLHPLKEA